MSDEMEPKKPGKRRKFSEEFKAEAARLVLEGRGLNQVARELGLSVAALCRWVQRARGEPAPAAAAASSPVPAADKRTGSKQAAALTGGEREELVKLRREVQQLQQERDFLKKAAAFFARESERK